MFLLLHKMYKNKNIHLFLISTLIFIIINTVENYIHYNIGRHWGASVGENIKLESPTSNDWIKITGIMLLFAVIQGGLTFLLNKRI